MTLTKVTREQLQAQMQELRILNGQFRKTVKEIDNLEMALSAVWEENEQNMKHTEFLIELNQMNHFYHAIEDYSAKLDAITASR